jgi:HSP20 family protein
MAAEQTPVKREAESGERTRPGRTYLPGVDIAETDDALWLRADMPGVDEKSVEVSLEEDVLTLHGRVSLEEYENLEPLYTEYNVGDFERRFRLSGGIDAGRIRGQLVNGVLSLELPKSERVKSRRIEIAAE